MNKTNDTNVYLLRSIKHHRFKIALMVLGLSLIFVSAVLSVLVWGLSLAGLEVLPYPGIDVGVVGVLILFYCFWDSRTLKLVLQGFENASRAVLSRAGYDDASRYDRQLQRALTALAVASALSVFVLPLLLSAPVQGACLSVAMAAFCAFQFMRAKPVQQPVEAGILEDTRWLSPLGTQAQMQYGAAMSKIVQQDRPITFLEYVIMRSYLLARFEPRKRAASE